MILQFAFHVNIIIFIIWLIYPLASAQGWITSQPGCNSSCGTIVIPFPFGMQDPKCYADKWFEIECRNSSSEGEKPYLKSLNLEVRYIYVSLGLIDVMNPITHSNCRSNNKDKAGITYLRGSPFVYSQEENTFVAVGCNNLAFLHSNGTTVGGCVSICDDNEQVDNSFDFASEGCHGRYCCQTSLPMHLSEFNATLEDLRSESRRNHTEEEEECSYMMIVSDYWISFQSNYMSYLEVERFSELKNMDYVPAELEWEILNEMLINSTLKLPSEAHCYKTNVTSSQNRYSGWRCQCPTGYYGNPYISRGCTAIPGFFDKNNQAKKWAIVGVLSSLGSIILLFGLWLLYKVVRKRMIKKRREKFFKKNGGLLLQQRMTSGEVNVDRAILFSLKDLKKATDNFNMNRVLGKGGQGTVYKGMLVDGKIVAVKKFKVEGKIEEFINEFVILSQINHRNVVKLLGCCLETEIPLLVYEFIPNGEKEHIFAVANLANRCLELNGKKRPTMKEVTLELEGIRGLNKKSDVQQDHEEIELVEIEDHQPWTGYSTSNSLPALNSGTWSSNSNSEVIPILTLQ
ncbi:Wall-associated receptor kinase, galacturonan-binding domain [Sesbania bispinosa]|nr:Wall-associated receptor kinase, galacturonan-binding domain [Sesbania bispinosa]